MSLLRNHMVLMFIYAVATGVYFAFSPWDYERYVIDMGAADVPADKLGVVVKKFGTKLDPSQVLADPKLTCDVALKLPTFSATAEIAGISRVMGGYHIQADNIEGLRLGRRVAEFTWPRTRAYFEGTATIR